MYLLSLDTCYSQGSLSLFKDKKIIDSSNWGEEHNHSEILSFKFQALLKKNNIDLKKISQILVSHGPGSFTGIRVGLNFAKSIAYANSAELFLSLSFRSFINIEALSSFPKTKFVVMNNAFKNQIFVCFYQLNDDGQIVEKMLPHSVRPAELEMLLKNENQVHFAGNGFETYADHWSEEFKNKALIKNLKNFNPSENQASIMFAYDYCLNFEKTDSLTARPLYLRGSEAEEKLISGELKKHTERKL